VTELPEGFERGERSEPPEGWEGRTPPEGFEEGVTPPELPEGGFANDGTITQVEASTAFFMQDKVNNFSGVTAA